MAEDHPTDFDHTLHQHLSEDVRLDFVMDLVADLQARQPVDVVAYVAGVVVVDAYDNETLLDHHRPVGHMDVVAFEPAYHCHCWA